MITKIILNECSEVWPIYEKSKKPPSVWSGWPNNKKFAFVLTHDIDTKFGYGKCENLMELEMNLGFRSSFNFVPEKYSISSELRHSLANNGFEVGVHDLNHDGKLYNSVKIFQKRAVKINRYLHDWKSVGFRSGSMHCNLEWLLNLNMEYDASTFDTDPFEPISEGVETIFPFRVSNNVSQKGYVELPYTLPQDFTLFVLMKEKSIDIWKKKLDWIAENGGMVLVITHPDYMNFNRDTSKFDEYPVRLYSELLSYIKTKYEGQYWHALPREIARFCNKNSAKETH